MMESQTLLLTLLTVKVTTEPRSRALWGEGQPLWAPGMEFPPA